jgi:hypothetical protein
MNSMSTWRRPYLLQVRALVDVVLGLADLDRGVLANNLAKKETKTLSGRLAPPLEPHLRLLLQYTIRFSVA